MNARYRARDGSVLACAGAAVCLWTTGCLPATGATVESLTAGMLPSVVQTLVSFVRDLLLNSAAALLF
ncbi:MAG: hypothetical protein ACE5F9_01675 [Phycisphaerae bacterium]